MPGAVRRRALPWRRARRGHASTVSMVGEITTGLGYDVHFGPESTFLESAAKSVWDASTDHVRGTMSPSWSRTTPTPSGPKPRMYVRASPAAFPKRADGRGDVRQATKLLTVREVVASPNGRERCYSSGTARRGGACCRARMTSSTFTAMAIMAAARRARSITGSPAS
jgi:hypothetical protein